MLLDIVEQDVPLNLALKDKKAENTGKVSFLPKSDYKVNRMGLLVRPDSALGQSAMHIPPGCGYGMPRPMTAPRVSLPSVQTGLRVSTASSSFVTQSPQQYFPK